MPENSLKTILVCFGLSAVGVFLIWTGIQEGNWINLIVGAICMAFFGLGTLVLLWRRFGPVPKPRATLPLTHNLTRPRAEFTLADREAFVRVLDVLVKFGVFLPDAPTAQQLEAAAADYGGRPALDTPIDAVFSTSYFDLEFEASRYTANLRLQHNKLEQTSEVIASQITDIVDLSEGALTATNIQVNYLNETDVEVTWTLNGSLMKVRYKGAAKYLSTILLHRVAEAYKNLGLGQRMAGIFSDGNLYLTRLPDGAVEAITDALNINAESPSFIYWMDDSAQAHEAG